MKTFMFAFLFLVIVLSGRLLAQTEMSCATIPPEGEVINPAETHGIYLPAQGDLKILVVFARFKDDVAPHPEWPPGADPNGYTTWIGPTMQIGSRNLKNFTYYAGAT